MPTKKTTPPTPKVAKPKFLKETSSGGTPGGFGGKNPKSKLPTKKKMPITVVLFLIILLIVAFRGIDTSGKIEKVALSEFIDNFYAQTYEKVEIKDQKIIAHKSDESIHTTVLPLNDRLTNIIQLRKTPDGQDIASKVDIIDTSAARMWANLAPTIIGLILFIGLAVLLMGKMANGAGGPMMFGKNKAKRFDKAKGKILFKDVAGSEEEKEDLQEFVEFLKKPEKFRKLGAKIPRGVLMVGPPGTGKTLLARAVAGESNVPFYSISGSEFVEMFVGVGAARVRDLFKEARENSPAIIFIDEIDAIGKKRSPGFGGGHDEREQTLNQILTEMDGFDNETNVIIMGATNRADVLDKALLRPGRFDRKVTISLPNQKDREAILEVHAKNKPLAEGVKLDRVASATVGFAGADLENLLNESAILAGRKNAKKITQEMLQLSIEKIVMGNTKKTQVMSDYEKKITAYHEVGHALVGKFSPHSDPVHKVSIVSRGRAAGVTWFLPEKDRILVSKSKMLDELVVLYAGRASEEIFFGKDYITTGASNDIERATDIARDMVTRYGFDEEIGMENIAGAYMDGNHLGYSEEANKVSDSTHALIDSKVRGILKNAYDSAKEIILNNKDLHEKISNILIEKEEIDREEFDLLFEGVNVPEKVSQ